ADHPRAPYSTHGVLTVLGPETGAGYPLAYPVVWLFAQFQGDAGEYEIWVDLFRTGDATGEEFEVATYGPWGLTLRPDAFVETRGWKLRNVPFSEPGLYEFRVRCGADVLATEGLLLAEE